MAEGNQNDTYEDKTSRDLAFTTSVFPLTIPRTPLPIFKFSPCNHTPRNFKTSLCADATPSHPPPNKKTYLPLLVTKIRPQSECLLHFCLRNLASVIRLRGGLYYRGFLEDMFERKLFVVQWCPYAEV